MADAASPNQLFELWRKQFEEGAQAWTRLVGQAAATPTPDPTAFWRPVLDQGVQTWAKLFAQTPTTPDLLTQWKQFLDQWIEAWSEVLGQTIAEIAPGDHADLVRLVEEDDIASFIDAVGDLNPVHNDAAYAATTPFKGPIAPGIFTAGLISAVIGTRLPGPGAVYLSQSLKFVKPVKAGDRSE